MKHTKEIEKISDYIQVLQYGPYSWVNVSRTNREEMRFLQEEFEVDPIDLGDALPPLQRPKITIRDDYIFMVLLFPVEEQGNQLIRAAKVDVFIFPEMVITLHENDLPPMEFIVDQVEAYMREKESPNGFAPKMLVPWLLLNLYGYCLPISNRIATNIDAIEEVIFSEDLANRVIVKRLFNIEREVVDFRKIMRSHEMIMDKLAEVLPSFSSGQLHTSVLQDLTEYPRVIWTNLESHVEAIDTLRQTYESLSSFYLNDILKTLAIISIIIAPMTLIASIFGMNFEVIPYSGHPQGFTFSILLMIGISILATFYFKWKKWF